MCIYVYVSRHTYTYIHIFFYLLIYIYIYTYTYMYDIYICMTYISRHILLVLLVDIVDEGMLASVLQQVHVEVILSRGYRNPSL